MRSYPIDATRVNMISTGTCKAVTKWIELSDGSRRPDPQGRQETDEHGRPVWTVEVILPADADDERDRTGVTEITVVSKDRPDAGSFGEMLVFDELTMQPGYINRKTGQLTAPRWTAAGIRRNAKPQAA